MQSSLAFICLLTATGVPTSNEALHKDVHVELLSKQEIMKNMTMDSALQLFVGMTDATPNAEHQRIALMVQNTINGGTETNLRNDVDKPVMKAKKMFNKMMQASDMKAEVERIRCQEFERKQTLLMKEARADIATYNSQASGARAEVLRAQSQITLLTQKIPQAITELKQLNIQCSQDTMTKRSQLKTARSDLKILKKLVKKVKCKSKASLLQCNCTDGSPAFTLEDGDDDVSDLLKQLDSDYAKQYLQGSFLQAFGEVPLGNIRPVLMQDAEGAADAVRRQLGACGDEEGNSTDLDVSPPVNPPYIPGTRPIKLPQPKPIYRPVPCAVVGNTLNKLPPASSSKCVVSNKCSVATHPSCRRMKDTFMGMLYAVMNQKSRIKVKLVKVSTRCKLNRNDLRTELSEMQSNLRDAQTSLAIATKQQDMLEAQSSHASLHFKRLDKEFRIEMRSCCKNQNEFTSQRCALEKLREELDKLTNVKKKVVDCEVSKWIPEECSQSCGGGTQLLKRSVVVQPSGGADCPPLKLTRQCNTEDCPVDCEMGDWSGWSSCTAECGGGVNQRLRSIKVDAQNGGTPCLPNIESKSCNVQSCDADCEMSEWSDWTACTKMCNSGTQSHFRTVLKAARGSGICPEPRSSHRMGFQTCNTFSCIQILPPTRPTLECKSKVDILLVMDGSGSLGSFGFDQSKKMVDSLLKAFAGGTNDVRAGLLLYSGPLSGSAAAYCVPQAGVLPMPKGGQDIYKLCNMRWISRFSSDLKGIQAKVKALPWPRGGTNTAMALGLAEQELVNSRPNTNSVVIVLTDGLPKSKDAVSFMSKRLQQKSRLMWVPVGRLATRGIKDIEKWATPPKSDNVIAISSFNSMTSNTAINSIVSSACPRVG